MIVILYVIWLAKMQSTGMNIKRNMAILKYNYKTCHIEGKINIHTPTHCFMILSLHYYNNERNFSGNNFFISLHTFYFEAGEYTC